MAAAGEGIQVSHDERALTITLVRDRQGTVAIQLIHRHYSRGVIRSTACADVMTGATSKAP
jgi:hypothetical protein